MEPTITISGRHAERLLSYLDDWREADVRYSQALFAADHGGPSDYSAEHDVRVSAAVQLASFLSYALRDMHAEEVG